MSGYLDHNGQADTERNEKNVMWLNCSGEREENPAEKNQANGGKD